MSSEFIEIQPGARYGNVTVPWSKSHLHRVMIADFLAGQTPRFADLELAEDVQATSRCLEMLKSDIAIPVLDCAESGSTLRFLLPVAMVCRNQVAFIARGRLPQRPIEPFLKLLQEHGVTASCGFPLHLDGHLTPGIFSLPGNISSQIITGLLFALPVLSADSEICLTSPLESRGYVEMTLDVIRAYGIMITENERGYVIPGSQQYQTPDIIAPERDWSGAAFWIAMNWLGSNIKMEALKDESKQPDRAINRLLEKIGGVLDVSQCPDLFPVLAMVAGTCDATTVFAGVRRLRSKESDRLAAMADVLEKFGVKTEQENDRFMVFGKGQSLSCFAAINTFNDHRIAMAAAVGATVSDTPVKILNPECVKKSYPEFFVQFDNLNVK